MQSDKEMVHSGLSQMTNEFNEIVEYYDNWANDYNQVLADWRYESPERIAEILREKLPSDSLILDAGCGTGLCGKALKSAGFKHIDGIDVSPKSLELAGEMGVYNTLTEVNLQKIPTSLPENKYDAIACVGVFTYLEDGAGALKEFCRTAKSGSVVALTQRSDLFESRQFAGVLEGLAREGFISDVHVSEGHPYLPEHEEFADQILVHYIDFVVQ